jgi:dihydropteroate synthase
MSYTTLNCNGKLLDLSLPIVMGIINITPDSFFKGSRFQVHDDILRRAGQIIEEGGQIIDVGGFSTRPGANEVSETEETDRIAMAVSCIREVYKDIPISIDTFRTKVAETGIQEGADIINDISAGMIDENMFDAVARLKVPYILMHNVKGDLATMQKQTSYHNITADLLRFFSEKVNLLRTKGVNDIILDPGFGFAKDIEQNYELMAHLSLLKQLGLPMLVGISRKRMIWQLLETNADESLNGTTVLNVLALQQGADILRVHDVKEAAEAVKIFLKYKEGESAGTAPSATYL